MAGGAGRRAAGLRPRHRPAAAAGPGFPRRRAQPVSGDRPPRPSQGGGPGAPRHAPRGPPRRVRGPPPPPWRRRGPAHRLPHRRPHGGRVGRDGGALRQLGRPALAGRGGPPLRRAPGGGAADRPRGARPSGLPLPAPRRAAATAARPQPLAGLPGDARRRAAAPGERRGPDGVRPRRARRAGRRRGPEPRLAPRRAPGRAIRSRADRRREPSGSRPLAGLRRGPLRRHHGRAAPRTLRDLPARRRPRSWAAGLRAAAARPPGAAADPV